MRDDIRGLQKRTTRLARRGRPVDLPYQTARLGKPGQQRAREGPGPTSSACERAGSHLNQARRTRSWLEAGELSLKASS